MTPRARWALVGGLVGLAWWSQRVSAATGDDDVMTADGLGAYGDGLIAMAKAIARAEGYGVPGAIPTRANNPGDLALGNQGGGTLGAEKITVFASPSQGWSALYRQLALVRDGRSHNYSASETFADFAQTYAPDQPEWLANVLLGLAQAGYNVSAESFVSEVLSA